MPVRTHRLTAFTFANPISESRKNAGPDFLVSGSPENASNPNRVIAPGDVSPRGMQQKAAFVIDKLRKAVGEMGARWTDITGCQIYTLQPVEAVMEVLQPAGLTRVGLSLFPGYIPVIGFEGFNYEFELDVRSIAVEYRVAQPRPFQSVCTAAGTFILTGHENSSKDCRLV